MSTVDNEAKLQNSYSEQDNSPEISQKTDYSLTKNNKWFVLYTNDIPKNSPSYKQQLISLKREALMYSMHNFKSNYNAKYNIPIFNICKQIMLDKVSLDQFEGPRKSFQKYIQDPNSTSAHKETLFPFSDYKTSLRAMTKINSHKSLEKSQEEIFDQEMEYSIRAFRNYHNSYMKNPNQISEMNLDHSLVNPTFGIKDNFNSKPNFKSPILNYQFEIEKVDTHLPKNLLKCIYPREPEPSLEPSPTSSKSKKAPVNPMRSKPSKEPKTQPTKKVVNKDKKTKNENKLKNKKKLEKIKRRERFAFLDLHKLKKSSEYYKDISKCFSFDLDQLLTHQKLIDDLLSQREDHEIIADMDNLNKQRTFTSYLNKKKPGFDFKKEYETQKNDEVESDKKKKQIRSFGLLRKYVHEKILIICSIEELEFLLSRVRGEKMLKRKMNYRNSKIVNIILHKRNN
jgi:hypothetical protein